ncbi:hypothetical protein G6M50_26460 [Agrobacterium rhizogenes]|nr:hypothetical protein [Rhizobium rhizogenes]NTJ81333.1 hypothetical protein [Rhizobium rhizogenes]
MIGRKFKAVPDGPHSWSVVYARNDEVVRHQGVALSGLSKALAEDLAKLLNLEKPEDKCDNPAAS